MVKNQKGFTLVEVIVVAVIVAVLAAVAIPLYNGYIRDSRYNVACNVAGSVASACGATLQQGETIAEGEHTGICVIIFPAVTVGEDNVVNVPQDFTVDIDENSVICTYKKGGTGEVVSETYQYTAGS